MRSARELVFSSVGQILSGAVVLAGVVWPVSAGVRRHDVDDSLYLALAQEPQFAAVGQLLINGGATTCTGTLISDRWVLTAAHCVDGNTTSVLWGTDTAFGIVDEIVLHPDWDPSNFFGGNDIALVRLSSAVTNVDPAAIYTGSEEIGAVGTSVGYGRSGTGLTGDIAGTQGFKRAGNNVLDVFGTARGWSADLLLTDFDNPLNANDSIWGDSAPLGLEIQVAPGDSGGPMFVQTANGYAIAGITSFISSVDGNPDADYGDISAYTRVSVYTPWIYSVTGVPTPGGVALLGTAFLAVCRRRR